MRWCPGCGDYAILAAMQKVMADMGVAPKNSGCIGIGCSSRLPYYVNSYGFHGIHGRSAAIATGVKVANPDLTVCKSPVTATAWLWAAITSFIV